MYWYVAYTIGSNMAGEVIDIHPFEFMKLNGVVVTYMREINKDEYELSKRLWR